MRDTGAGRAREGMERVSRVAYSPERIRCSIKLWRVADHRSIQIADEHHWRIHSTPEGGEAAVAELVTPRGGAHIKGGAKGLVQVLH